MNTRDQKQIYSSSMTNIYIHRCIGTKYIYVTYSIHWFTQRFRIMHTLIIFAAPLCDGMWESVWFSVKNFIVNIFCFLLLVLCIMVTWHLQRSVFLFLSSSLSLSRSLTEKFSVSNAFPSNGACSWKMCGGIWYIYVFYITHIFSWYC